MFQTQIHILAVLLLAAGLAIQTCRLITSHADRFHLLVRRTVPYLIALVAALGLCVGAWKLIPEYRALKKLPPAPKNAPNVLLIVLDTVRAESLSLYGYGRKSTPRLKKFAPSGVLFERAISTSSWTLPFPCQYIYR